MTPGDEVPHCRRCQASIIWITSEKGHGMPCDPDLVIATGKEENLKLVLDSGEVRHNPIAGTKGYISHFATCPAAHTFRKPKLKEGEFLE